MKYCVGIINFFDNELKHFVVEAESWQDALIKAEQESLEPNILDESHVEFINSLSSIDDAKQAYFDMDQSIEITEIGI